LSAQGVQFGFNLNANALQSWEQAVPIESAMPGRLCAANQPLPAIPGQACSAALIVPSESSNSKIAKLKVGQPR